MPRPSHTWRKHIATIATDAVAESICHNILSWQRSVASVHTLRRRLPASVRRRSNRRCRESEVRHHGHCHRSSGDLRRQPQQQRQRQEQPHRGRQTRGHGWVPQSLVTRRNGKEEVVIAQEVRWTLGCSSDLGRLMERRPHGASGASALLLGWVWSTRISLVGWKRQSTLPARLRLTACPPTRRRQEASCSRPLSA